VGTLGAMRQTMPFGDIDEKLQVHKIEFQEKYPRSFDIRKRVNGTTRLARRSSDSGPQDRAW
jgi:hypothetical protein